MLSAVAHAGVDMELKIVINADRIVEFVRTCVATRRRRLASLLVLSATPLLVYATTKPNTFVDGTTISAGQVNQNFDTAFSAITTLENKIPGTPGTTYVRWGRPTC